MAPEKIPKSITKFAVSIHLLTALAYNPGKWMSSEELSKSLCTNPSFVRKLIVDLARAELIQSLRGKAGGVQLAKKPSSIDLSEIYLAVSEHNRIEIPHKEPYTDCPVSCAMGNILSKVSTKVEEDIIQSLKKTKLSELVQQVIKQS